MIKAPWKSGFETIRIVDIKERRQFRDKIKKERERNRRIQHLEILSHELKKEVKEKENAFNRVKEMSELLLNKVSELKVSKDDLEGKYELSLDDMREVRIQNENLKNRLARNFKELEEIKDWSNSITKELNQLRHVNSKAIKIISRKDCEIMKMKEEIEERIHHGHAPVPQEIETKRFVNEINKLQDENYLLRKVIDEQKNMYEEKLLVECEKRKGLEAKVQMLEISRKKYSILKKSNKRNSLKVKKMDTLKKQIQEYQKMEKDFFDLLVIREKYDNLRDLEVSHERLCWKYEKMKKEMRQLEKYKYIVENLDDYKNLELKLFNEIGEKVQYGIKLKNEKIKTQNLIKKEMKARKKYKFMKYAASFGMMTFLGAFYLKMKKN